MSNKEQLELIAQAREVLTDFISLQNEKIASVKEEAKSTGLPDHPFNRDRISIEEFILSLATTHLAEMDEWQKYVDDCTKAENAGPDYFAKYPSLVDKSRSLQHQLVTKAKRLLGRE